MIEERNGDVLESGADVICHQVNCMGVMGAGLARQIRERWPHVYSTYQAKCRSVRQGHGGLGDIQVVGCGSCSIANLFSQYGFGSGRCHTDYKALEKCLQSIREVAESMGYRVALPYGIGCGLAGGDWDVVSGIIRRIFDNSPVTAEIWRL